MYIYKIPKKHAYSYIYARKEGSQDQNDPGKEQ